MHACANPGTTTGRLWPRAGAMATTSPWLCGSWSAVRLGLLDLRGELRCAVHPGRVVGCGDDAARRDPVEDGQAAGVDRTEDGVVGPEHRVLVDQEELAAVGVRTRIGHRDRAAGVDPALAG